MGAFSTGVSPLAQLLQARVTRCCCWRCGLRPATAVWLPECGAVDEVFNQVAHRPARADAALLQECVDLGRNVQVDALRESGGVKTPGAVGQGRGEKGLFRFCISLGALLWLRRVVSRTAAAMQQKRCPIAAPCHCSAASGAGALAAGLSLAASAQAPIIRSRRRTQRRHPLGLICGPASRMRLLQPAGSRDGALPDLRPSGSDGAAV